MPRRVATGVDPKRLAMIVAVLSRHAGVALGQADVFVNVAGGVRIDEPGADLAVALAIASAARGVPVRGGHRRLRRDRPHRPPPRGDAGRAAARGVREARARPRVVAPAGHAARMAQLRRHARVEQTLRQAIKAGTRCRDGAEGDDESEPPEPGLGFTRTPSEDDPRRDPKLLAAIARIAPGTELRQASTTSSARTRAR